MLGRVEIMTVKDPKFNSIAPLGGDIQPTIQIKRRCLNFSPLL